MALAIPVAFSIWYGNTFISAAIMIIAFLTDVGDGYFARKMNQVTETGKIIDPLADKVFVNTVIIVLLIPGSIPLWFGFPVLLRDVLIILGSLILRNKLKHVLPSDYIGKISALVIALCILGIVLKFRFVMDYGLYIALIFMIVSLINYSIRMFKNMANDKKI